MTASDGRRGRHPVGVDLPAGRAGGVDGSQDVGEAGGGVTLPTAVEGVEEADEGVERATPAAVVAVVSHQVGEAMAPDLEGQLGRRVDRGPCRQPVTQRHQRGQPGVGVHRRAVGEGPAPDPSGLEGVEPGQRRHQQPVESRRVAVHPAQHVDHAGDDRVVGRDGRDGDGGGDAVAGQGPGDRPCAPGRAAQEDGHVGPLDPLVAGGQQLGGDRLHLERRVPAGHQHRRRRAAEGVVTEVDAGGGVDAARVPGEDGVVGVRGKLSEDAPVGLPGNLDVVDEDVPEPIAATCGQQVGGPAEQAGQVRAAHVGECPPVPGQEPLQLGPGRVVVGTRPRRAVLEKQEAVGDLGGHGLAAEEMTERRPRRAVLLGQEAGYDPPLLGADDESERAVAAGDDVVGEAGDGGDRQAVEPAGQPRQHSIPEARRRPPAPAQHEHRRRRMLPHEAQVPCCQCRRLTGAGGPVDLHDAAVVVDHPLLRVRQLHPRRAYRAGETALPGSACAALSSRVPWLSGPS